MKPVAFEVNFTIQRQKCELARSKSPKRTPNFIVRYCLEVKHISCQKHTKADVKLLINLNISWTCKECISDILPVNASLAPKKINTLKQLINSKSNVLRVQASLILLEMYVPVTTAIKKFTWSVGTIVLVVTNFAKQSYLASKLSHMNS